mmetsp:Transcript_80868/g.135252  ORF Transcript_80868/g.135252 Transcript_80868/m.135252 type:complete len:82 (+) Transcript_80868:51-296(+)
MCQQAAALKQCIADRNGQGPEVCLNMNQHQLPYACTPLKNTASIFSSMNGMQRTASGSQTTGVVLHTAQSTTTQKDPFVLQ